MPFLRLRLRGISCQILAKRTNQFCVDRIRVGPRLALKILVFAFVKIAAIEQFQFFLRAIGGGKNIVLGGLVPHQLAIRFMRDHVNMLHVDVILTQLY